MGVAISRYQNAINMATGKTPSQLEAQLKAMFAPGYVFPMQDVDRQLSVRINDSVNFGDIKDSVESGPVLHVAEKLWTARQFVPGNYTMSVIKPYSELGEYQFNDPLVIFHHDSLNPNLLALRVIKMNEDYSRHHENLSNCLGRMDWCHWTHFEEHVVFQSDPFDGDFCNDYSNMKLATNNAASKGQPSSQKAGPTSKVPLVELFPPEYRTVIYFVRREDAKDLQYCLLKSHVRRSTVNKYLFSIYNDGGVTIAIGINYSPFITNEYVYGRVFEDKDTNAAFALIVNGSLTLDCGPWNEVFTPQQRKDIGFTTIQETGLKFKMSEFAKK